MHPLNFLADFLRGALPHGAEGVGDGVPCRLRAAGGVLLGALHALIVGDDAVSFGLGLCRLLALGVRDDGALPQRFVGRVALGLRKAVLVGDDALDGRAHPGGRGAQVALRVGQIVGRASRRAVLLGHPIHLRLQAAHRGGRVGGVFGGVFVCLALVFDRACRVLRLDLQGVELCGEVALGGPCVQQRPLELHQLYGVPGGVLSGLGGVVFEFGDGVLRLLHRALGVAQLQILGALGLACGIGGRDELVQGLLERGGLRRRIHLRGRSGL